MIHSRSNPWEVAGQAPSPRSEWLPDGAPSQHASAFSGYRGGIFFGTEYQSILPNSSIPNTVLPLPPTGEGATAWPQELGGLARQAGPSQPRAPDGALQDADIRSGTEQSSRHKRSVRRDLPWDDYKQTMHDLYMGQHKTLRELREYMAETHQFKATEKQYKDQFRQWDWRRYLKKRESHFMRAKASERRRQNPPKDTVFEWGGQMWTVDRIMKSCAYEEDGEDEHQLDQPTPFGMTYHTPRNPAVPCVSARLSTSPNLAQANARPSIGPPTQQYGIRLRWNGHTVADISNIMDQAKERELLKDFEGADEKFTETLEACRNLLPPAHQLTADTTYQVARFHARQNNMTRADAVLDDLTDQFVSQRGKSHASTLGHYAMIAQLLEAWDRHEDVLSLVRRLTNGFEYVTSFPNDSSQNVHAAMHFDLPSILASTRLSTNRAEGNIATSPQVLQMEVEHVPVIDLEGSDRLEQRVLNLLDQLMKSPDRNLADIVRTKHLLVSVYSKSDMHNKATEAFEQAKDCIRSLCRLECSKPKEFFTATVDLAEYGLKQQYTNDANYILDVVKSEAVTAYGPDHSYIISLLIRIGKVVQKTDSWEEAEAHFEQAYAACITAFGHKALVTRRLEKALDEGNYSGDLDDDISDNSVFESITL